MAMFPVFSSPSPTWKSSFAVFQNAVWISWNAVCFIQLSGFLWKKIHLQTKVRKWVSESLSCSHKYIFLLNPSLLLSIQLKLVFKYECCEIPAYMMNWVCCKGHQLHCEPQFATIFRRKWFYTTGFQLTLAFVFLQTNVS